MITSDRLQRRSAPSRLLALSAHVVDDEVLVYDPETRATHRLNATARFIWENCDGNHTADDIALEMAKVWDVPPDQARTDVAAAVDLMIARRLLELRAAEKS